MDFNFNVHYPAFQWPNSYIPNAFSTASNHPAHPTVPQHAPTPPAAVAVFPIPENTVSSTTLPVHGGFNAIAGGGSFPFGIHGSYPNSHPTASLQTTPYVPNWNYGFNNNSNNVGCYTPLQQAQSNITNDFANSVPSTNNSSSCEKTMQDSITGSSLSLDGKDKKLCELSKDSIADQLLAMKVSSLLLDSSILKNVISKSLLNVGKEESCSKNQTENNNVGELASTELKPLEQQAVIIEQGQEHRSQLQSSQTQIRNVLSTSLSDLNDETFNTGTDIHCKEMASVR